MITMRLALAHMNEDNAEEFAEALKRHKGAVDHIWIPSCGTYPEMEVHEKYVKSWKKAIEKFRNTPVKISLQISQTIGHSDAKYAKGEGTAMMVDGEYVDTLVDADGTKNYNCYCWNSPRVIEYNKKVTAFYASALKPDRIWFDDDLRPEYHTPTRHTCFCGRCMEKFNSLYSTQFTRESLSYEINYGDLIWRERFIEFTRKSLYDFTYALASAASEASAYVTFGFQCGHRFNYAGKEDNYVLQALYDASGEKEVHTRPGAGFYNDKHPWGQFEKAMDLAFQNSTLPHYVTECKAEIEDLPGVAYGKSIGGIINEGTLYLATGCTGLTFTDIQSCHEKMSYYEKILAKFSENRAYWEKLSEISKTCYGGGICIFEGEKPYMKKLSKEDAPFSWIPRIREFNLNLFRIGIPTMYDMRGAKSYILHNQSVDALSDDDIKFLLTKPVITDGESIKKLTERGYGKYFGFDIINVPVINFEVFTEHSVNTTYVGMHLKDNRYASVPMPKYIFENIDSSVEVLGEGYLGRALVGSCERLGNTTVLAEIKNPFNDKKVKWAIFGFFIWNDITSSAKRDQILNAIDTISPLPARLISNEQAAVSSFVDKDGKTVSLTVACASQGGTEEILVSARNVKGRNITVMSTRNKSITPLDIKEVKDEIYITLPPLIPYEIATVFFN